MTRTPRSQKRKRISVPAPSTPPTPPHPSDMASLAEFVPCAGSSVSSNTISRPDSISPATGGADSYIYNHGTAEPPVPELYNDLSTTSLTDDAESSVDIASPSSASRSGSDHLDPTLVPVEEYASRQNHAVSIYHASLETRLMVIPHDGGEGGSDENDEDDGESTILSTRSINPLDLPYMTENDRQYCGDYYMPIDDTELSRLYLFHQVYLKILDSQLTTVPLEDPTHILDIGTGSGDWAMDIAEQFPDCEVTGIDIAGVFERKAPINCFWEVDDAEFEWERPSNHYDLVHLRTMHGAFKDWRFVYESAYRCLKPGGWIEIMDFVEHQDMGGVLAYFEPQSPIHQFMASVNKAAEMTGKPRGAEHLEPRMLYEAGYIDVRVTDYSIPLKLNDGSIGKTWLVAQLATLEAIGLRLLTTHMNWTPEEVREATASIAKELLELARSPGRSPAALRSRVLLGRKPQSNARWSVDSMGSVGKRTAERATERPPDTRQA